MLLLPEAVRQNPSVEAPFTMASTTIAAVTIRAPGMRWSSVMLRGFVRGPPGVQHCGGGPGADSFDLIAALATWVEKGYATPGDGLEARCGRSRALRQAAVWVS